MSALTFTSAASDVYKAQLRGLALQILAHHVREIQVLALYALVTLQVLALEALALPVLDLQVLLDLQVFDFQVLTLQILAPQLLDRPAPSRLLSTSPTPRY